MYACSKCDVLYMYEIIKFLLGSLKIGIFEKGRDIKMYYKGVISVNVTRGVLKR